MIVYPPNSAAIFRGIFYPIEGLPSDWIKVRLRVRGGKVVRAYVKREGDVLEHWIIEISEGGGWKLGILIGSNSVVTK